MRFVLALVLFCAAQAASAATLLVLYKDENTLAFIDPATLKEQAKVPTGNGPHEVEVSSDGRLAFVSDYGVQGAPGKTLTVIDLATRKVLRTVDLGALGQPHGLAVGGPGAYFTSEASKHIGHYDPVADKVDWKFETAQERTHMVAASADGRRLFTTNMGSNSVSIIEKTAIGGTQSVVQVGQGPEGFDVSPNGRELWAASASDGKVAIVDIATRKVVHTIDAATKRSNRLKFTPDGKTVLVSDLSGGELVVIDTATHAVKKRLAVGRGVSGILVQPDGVRAFAAVSAEARLAIVDLRTLEITGSVPTGRGVDGMAWVK